MKRTLEWLKHHLAAPSRRRKALEEQIARLTGDVEFWKNAKHLADDYNGSLRRENSVLNAGLESLEAELVSEAKPPGLTAAEIERLAWLAEECGEVVLAAGKVLRFGWTSASPYGGAPNRVALEREMGEVRAVIEVMAAAGDVRRGDIRSWQRKKAWTAEKWLLHQKPGNERGEMVKGE